MRKLLILLLFLAFPAVVCAEDQAAFAQRLNACRCVYHDRTYWGTEVVAVSSGRMTQELAMRIWNNSPRHRTLLPRIKKIVIVGRVAVGRG